MPLRSIQIPWKTRPPQADRSFACLVVADGRVQVGYWHPDMRRFMAGNAAYHENVKQWAALDSIRQD